jgi:hypothetical protein
MNKEMPTLNYTTAVSNTYGGPDWSTQWVSNSSDHFADYVYRPNHPRLKELENAFNESTAKPKKGAKLKTDIRVVQVFIIDPNDSLKLKDRMIYQGEPTLTDSTDEELFFELPITDMLKKHNDIRVKTKEKKNSKKYLEPARIRDLIMTVSVVASF